MTEENKEVKVEGVKEEKKYIGIDDFAKIELKVGKILEFHLIEGADKLYRFLVDVGEVDAAGQPVYRTILSGIREYFPEGEVFIGKYVCVVANLAPRKMRGFESNGMLLFAGGGSEAVPGNLFMVTPQPSISGEPKPGTIIR
jgi:methionyl-tRNA synthetase